MKEKLLLVLFTANVFSMNLWKKCDQRSKQNEVAMRRVLEILVLWGELKPSMIYSFPMWRRTFPRFVNDDAQFEKIITKTKKPNQITVAELKNRKKSVQQFNNLVLIYLKFFAIVAAFAFGDVFSTVSMLIPALFHLLIMTAGLNYLMKKIVLTSTGKWQNIQIYVPIVAMIMYVLFAIIGFKKISAIDNNFCSFLESTGITIPDAFKQLDTTCVLNNGFIQNVVEYKKQMVASFGFLGYAVNAGANLWNTVIKQIAKSKIGTCSSLNCSLIISRAKNRRTVYYSAVYRSGAHRRLDSQSIKFFENTESEDHLYMDKFGRIDESGNLNHVNEYGRNLAHDVALFGRLQLMKFLATKNVDLNKSDNDGNTPVSEAARFGTTEMVKFLAEQGVDLNKPDKLGRTPVSKAAFHGKIDNVKFLAEQGVDLNKPDKDGETPFFKAATECETEIIKFLAEQGVDLDTPDNGRTLVWEAAACETTEPLKFFAKRGFHLNKPTKYFGETPVWNALRYGRTETMKFLEKQGVDLNQSDDMGRTLLDVAARFGRKETVKFLLQKNVKFNEKFFQEPYRNSDEIKWLITEGYRVNKFKIFQNIQNKCALYDQDFNQD